MTDYHWPDLYERAVQFANGDRPGIELEGRIVEHFEQDPVRVERAIERVGNDYQRGAVRSFWAVLDAAVSTPAEPRFTTTATAKQPNPWKNTNHDWEPELPPAPRKLPAFVQAFVDEHWPKPLSYDPD